MESLLKHLHTVRFKFALVPQSICRFDTSLIGNHSLLISPYQVGLPYI